MPDPKVISMLQDVPLGDSEYGIGFGTVPDPMMIMFEEVTLPFQSAAVKV
jgi:hypothetical protein